MAVARRSVLWEFQPPDVTPFREGLLPGLVFASVPQAPFVNLVTGAIASTAGAPVGSGVMGQQYGASNLGIGNWATSGHAFSIPAGGNTTTLVVYGDKAVGTSNGRIYQDNSSGTTFLINSSAGRPFVRISGVTLLNPSSGIGVGSTPSRAAVYRVASASFVDAWYFGTKTYSASHSTAMPALTFDKIGSDPSEYAGNIALILIWNYLLPDALSAELSARPWHVFAPRKRSVPISSSAFPTLSNLRFYPATPTGGYLAVDMA